MRHVASYTSYNNAIRYRGMCAAIVAIGAHAALCRSCSCIFSESGNLDIPVNRRLVIIFITKLSGFCVKNYACTSVWCLGIAIIFITTCNLITGKVPIYRYCFIYKRIRILRLTAFKVTFRTALFIALKAMVIIGRTACSNGCISRAGAYRSISSRASRYFVTIPIGTCFIFKIAAIRFIFIISIRTFTIKCAA